MHPLVALMRRFALDWLGRADPSVCAQIMDPSYSVHIGGHTLDGRDDAYVPATLTQLDRFPGLLLSVGALWTDGERVAMRFTEHGPSAADDGQPAAWSGIGLFFWDGERLTRNVTEEDYHSRRRQLAQRVCDPVESPAAAPWTAAPEPADPGAEAAVREWLATADLTAARLDDGRSTAPLLDVDDVEVGELFSTGPRVAFQAVQAGRYLGGLPDTDGCAGRKARMSVVGMLRVDDGRITGHVVRDRAGLRRTVRA